MATINDPSAVIKPGAIIGNDCKIGPFCIIGPNVVLGDRVELISNVVIDGNNNILSYPFFEKNSEYNKITTKRDVCMHRCSKKKGR